MKVRPAPSHHRGPTGQLTACNKVPLFHSEAQSLLRVTSPSSSYCLHWLRSPKLQPFQWRRHLLFGRVNGGRRLAHPLQEPSLAERNGRAAEGFEATPDRQTDTQFKMPPSAQHSFGFWCPDSLTLSFSADSPTTL